MLLPYSSDRPPRNPPLAVVSLVLTHFVVFGLVALVMRVRGPNSPVVWYANLSLVPGALHWYSFLTYAFLHEDVFHLSANMLFLWVFGGSVEDALKWKRFVALYAAAAAVTGALQVAVTYILPGTDRMVPIVGASGAVSAIVGVFAVRFYRSRIRFIGLPIQIPAILLLALVVVVEMAAALQQIVHDAGSQSTLAAAHWAHIGGFFLGLAIAQATRQMSHARQEYLAADATREMEQGSTVSAARRWEAVLKAQPDNMEAEAELGKAWAALGDRHQSETRYRRAISGLVRNGSKSEAARRYSEMTGFYPDAVLDPADLFAVASALEEQGSYAPAIAAFESLIRTAGQSREAEMSSLRTGMLYLNRLSSPRDAVTNLVRFIEQYPRSEWRSFADDLLKTARLRAKASQ